MATNIVTGCNRRVALEWAERLGCRVKPKLGTGDVVVWHPTVGNSIRVNIRKKSASRGLTAYLRRVERALNR